MFTVKIPQDMLGVVVHMCNLSTWEVDARGWATGDSVRKRLQQNTSQVRNQPNVKPVESFQDNT